MVVFLQNKIINSNLQTAVSSISKDSDKYLLSPFKMVPFVSQKKSRTNICNLKLSGTIAKICDKKYDSVSASDSKKIDDLFTMLSQVNKDSASSKMTKYLTTQLIFSTLPVGSSKTKSVAEFPTTLLEANVLSSQLIAKNNIGTTRAQYEKLLQDDFSAVKSNCPQPGNENWVFTAMCSEHKWINNVQQPIYSKQYAEYGGPCRSEAGAIEGYQIQSIVDTKMKSEYNFTDESGVSSQIACSFSCGSYKCPKYTEAEATRTQCANPIYYPHFDKKWSGELTAKEREISYETIFNECKDRSYDYVTRADGTSGLKKTRDCKISGSTGELYQDPPDYRPIYVETYCCSCAQSETDPYNSYYDFTQPGYKGKDWFKKMLDAVKKATPKDSTPKTPKTDATPKTPVNDAPARTPTSDANSLTAPTTTPTITPTTTPPAQDQPAVDRSQIVRFRFTCSITKKRWPDGYFEVHLDGKSEPVDANGNPTYATFSGITGGGVASRTKFCDSLTDVAPKCVNPLTGEDATSPIDIKVEYSLQTFTATQIDKKLTDYFWLMTNSDRQCTTEELSTPR